MPAKLPFRVVFCSSEADGHEVAQLEVHSPLVRGWQSARFCHWPQEIIFQMDELCRVRKIQLLSHQYKIATKIELFVSKSGPTPSSGICDPSTFVRLGHVSLSDNVENDFRSRELKSVHIDSMARFVRLLISKNHVNEHNMYNQVGLVALNLIGDGTGSASAKARGNPLSTQMLTAVRPAQASRSAIGLRRPPSSTGEVGAVTVRDLLGCRRRLLLLPDSDYQIRRHRRTCLPHHLSDCTTPMNTGRRRGDERVYAIHRYRPGSRGCEDARADQPTVTDGAIRRPRLQRVPGQ